MGDMLISTNGEKNVKNRIIMEITAFSIPFFFSKKKKELKEAGISNLNFVRIIFKAISLNSVWLLPLFPISKANLYSTILIIYDAMLDMRGSESGRQGISERWRPIKTHV